MPWASPRAVPRCPSPRAGAGGTGFNDQPSRRRVSAGLQRGGGTVHRLPGLHLSQLRQPPPPTNLTSLRGQQGSNPNSTRPKPHPVFRTPAPHAGFSTLTSSRPSRGSGSSNTWSVWDGLLLPLPSPSPPTNPADFASGVDPERSASQGHHHLLPGMLHRSPRPPQSRSSPEKPHSSPELRWAHPTLPRTQK